MKTIFYLLSAILLSGCASIMDGRDKPIHITSTPSGAQVTITDKKGKQVCTQATPANVMLERSGGFGVKAEYTLNFQSPGYAPAQANVRSVLNGWYLGNFLFGGLFGMLIDMGSGACHNLSPRDVNVILVAMDPSLTPAIPAPEVPTKPEPRPVIYPPKSQ